MVQRKPGESDNVFGVPVLNKVITENLLSEQRPEKQALRSSGVKAHAVGLARSQTLIPEFAGGQGPNDALRNEIPASQKHFP